MAEHVIRVAEARSCLRCQIHLDEQRSALDRPQVGGDQETAIGGDERLAGIRLHRDLTVGGEGQRRGIDFEDPIVVRQIDEAIRRDRDARRGAGAIAVQRQWRTGQHWHGCGQIHGTENGSRGADGALAENERPAGIEVHRNVHRLAVQRQALLGNHGVRRGVDHINSVARGDHQFPAIRG